MPKIKTAFLSIYDKETLDVYACKLIERRIEIWASNGTARCLAEHKIPARSINELTGFKELLGGRVKTLHPSVFSAILARSNDEDMRQLMESNLPMFDLVFVDLYPFVRALREGKSDDELIELIDIGGVSLLRAAAKNYKRVVPIHSIKGLEETIKSMDNENFVPEEFSRRKASETFFFTSYYDSAIAHWLWDDNEFPEYFSIAGAHEGLYELRYGENPHQKAKIYRVPKGNGVPSAKILGGKSLSYNNILDADSALSVVAEFDRPACVIIKHNSPCGIAIADSIEDAYRKAYDCDALSAFGGVVAFNRKVTSSLADILTTHFFEVIVAPGYSDDAISILRAKKNLRIIKLEETGRFAHYEFRSINGGLLVQNVNPPKIMAEKWEVVTEIKPTPEQELDMCFAMTSCKYVRSNAIVIAKDNATVGIGGGQPSRVDSAIIAVRKAGERAIGSVAASDAFLPFPDALEILAKAGVKALIQPGGSRNDRLVIDRANELGIAMVFSNMRHFRH